MIKQLIQTETKVLSSNTVIDCGNGDVAIGMADVKGTPYDSEFFQMYKSECREDHELPAVFQ